MCSNNKVIVFSLAMNGYQYLYRKNFETHRAYCKKNGYEYRLYNKPVISCSGKECAWFKLYLMLKIFQEDVDWVVFLDADTEVRTLAPAVETLSQENKSFYVANGYSERINSGVMIVKKDKKVSELMAKCLDSINMPLPVEDDVGWGENGHIIHFFKNQPCVQLIDQRWNNNVDPNLDDYIRHYSAGPLRASFTPSFVDKSQFILANYISRLVNKCYRVLALNPKPLGRLINSELDKYLGYTEKYTAARR